MSAGSRPVRLARGLTLIEILVVLAIVAILASLALPGYESYVRKTHRADARAALMGVLQDQERLRANCSTYASSLGSADNCAAGQLGSRTVSEAGRYSLALSS